MTSKKIANLSSSELMFMESILRKEFKSNNNQKQLQSIAHLIKAVQEQKDLNENKFPKFYRIIIGCASWAPGQIESEMLGSRTGGRSMWTNFPYTEDFMWNNQPVNQWNAGIEASANAKVTNYLNF